MEKQLRVVFSFTESELKKFEKYLEDSGVAAEKLNDQLKDVGKESDKAFSQAATGINQLVKGVKAFLALEVVNMIKNAAAEASKLAAAGEGVRSAFKNLGGSTEEIIKLREAVGGTVADIDLIRLSVSALQKGVKMDQFGEILKYVNKQAAATGASLEGLAEVAIRSIGKESTKGMAALGLSTKNVEENAKKLGFMPALMEEIGRKTKAMGELSNETADGYDRLAASQKNLKEAFGNLVNSKAFREVQGFLAGKVQAFADIANEGTDPLEERLAQVRRQVADRARRTGNLNPEQQKALAKFDAEKDAELLRLEAEYQKRKTDLQREQRKKNFEQSKIDLQAALDEQAEIDKQFQEDQDKLKKEKYQEFLDDKYKMNREAEIREADAQIEFLNKQQEAGLQAEQDLMQSILDPSSAFNAAKVDPTQEDLNRFLPEPEEVDTVFKPIETTSEKVKLDFQDALGATTQIAALFMTMGSEESGPGKFIKQLIAIAAPLLNTITGGVGGTVLSSFASFFNEGGMVGQPIGPNRDTVLAGLTLGEYVVKRDSTKRSALLLDAINAGEIDDKILLKLNQSPVVVNVDQAKVVEAIQNMPQVEFYKNGSILYEHRMSGANKRAERIRRISL